MTGLTAKRFGLPDRGLIAPGMAADLCVFNADTVIDQATFEEPKRASAGIAWVVTHPEEGGALPGSGRMAPPPEPLPVAAIAAPVETPVETPAPVEAPPVASGTPAEPVLPHP